jgi:hypothetical protein
MIKKHFVFSYTNILKQEINKKNYFSFGRKVINLIYKLIINILKKNFRKIINLDKKKNNLKFYNSSLSELFDNFNCDKGKFLKINHKEKIKGHNYAIFYEKYFQDLKNNKIKILELGSHEGKGIASFYYYLPYAKLYGANINPFQMKFCSKRIEEIYIDVSSKKVIESFSGYFKEGFDIIIDDASHNIRDILLTLPILFKNLKRGGYYVIEDINQFEVFKNLNPTNDKLTPLKILQYMQEGKKFSSEFITDEDVKYLKINIDKYLFEKGEMLVNGINISDIVFLKKNA